MLTRVHRHIPAFFTACVWGSTFVASKHVLSSGVQPIVLMTFRFTLSYIVLWIFCHEWQPIHFDRDELLLLLLGLSGGSLYFILEYSALQRTSAVNVGLISATVPIISVAISMLLGKTKIWARFIVGSILALIGVALVILNGNFSLTVRPIGDAIAILSAILWASYTVILDAINKDKSELFITRRLFFYALLTLFPFTILNTELSEFKAFAQIDTLLPSLYLGGFASALCILLWNISINKIGLSNTNNYLYLLPVVSVIASAIFAEGEISVYNIIGSVFILVGIIVADKRVKQAV